MHKEATPAGDSTPTPADESTRRRREEILAHPPVSPRREETQDSAGGRDLAQRPRRLREKSSKPPASVVSSRSHLLLAHTSASSHRKMSGKQKHNSHKVACRFHRTAARNNSLGGRAGAGRGTTNVGRESGQFRGRLRQNFPEGRRNKRQKVGMKGAILSGTSSRNQ